jgi:16S rRNA (cytosine1402-N4)-methyltransferase
MAAPQLMRLRLIDRIKPSQAEISTNARARSAVMRVAERTETL